MSLNLRRSRLHGVSVLRCPNKLFLLRVLDLIAVNIAGDTFANTESTVKILGELKYSLDQVLV
jgi:hypothetical protein